MFFLCITLKLKTTPIGVVFNKFALILGKNNFGSWDRQYHCCRLRWIPELMKLFAPLPKQRHLTYCCISRRYLIQCYT